MHLYNRTHLTKTSHNHDDLYTHYNAITKTKTTQDTHKFPFHISTMLLSSNTQNPLLRTFTGSLTGYTMRNALINEDNGYINIEQILS